MIKYFIKKYSSNNTVLHDMVKHFYPLATKNDIEIFLLRNRSFSDDFNKKLPNLSDYDIFKNENNYIIKTKKYYFAFSTIKNNYVRLIPSNRIPALYFIEIPIENNELKKDKDLALNLKYLPDLLKDFYIPDSWEEFYKNNKKDIDALNSNIGSQPKKIGKGMDGVAYDIGNQKILKLFKSRAAYLTALESDEESYNNNAYSRYEPKFYELGTLWYNDNEIYFYIIEKMDTSIVSKDQFDPFIDLIDYIDEYVVYCFYNKHLIYKDKFNKNRNDPDVINFISKLKKEIKLKANVISNYTKIERKYSNKLQSSWLDHLITEIIYKRLINRNDLHSGNLGITNQGLFKFFDPEI